MLYNKDWDVKTKDPFTLDNLIAWLETKDPTEEFNYYFNNNCLLAQWVKNIDINAQPNMASHAFSYIVNDQEVDFLVSHKSFMRNVINVEPWTFGAALERAKALRDGST